MQGVAQDVLCLDGLLFLWLAGQPPICAQRIISEDHIVYSMSWTPHNPRLTQEDIRAALAFAADSLAHETILLRSA